MKNQKIPVLCYHNIVTKEEMQNLPDNEKKFAIEVKNFDKQMRLFKKMNYKTLTLDEFYNWKKSKLELPYKSILITFDDGELNVYKYAMPILKKYQLNACIFIIGNKTITNNDKYMDLKLIKQCEKEYQNIEFASHSYDLHTRGNVESKNEEELKRDLEIYESTIKATEYFAYPYGHYNKEMIQALKEKSYKLAFAFGEPKKSLKQDYDFLIPRINVSFNQNPWKLMLKIMLPFIY